MARTAISEPSTTLPIELASKPLRQALMASGRQELVEGVLLPTWMAEFVRAAKSTSELGQSVLLLVPEISDVQALVGACERAGLTPVAMTPDLKRSVLRGHLDSPSGKGARDPGRGNRSFRQRVATTEVIER